jgi:phospholipase/lecithinase/hemolysin
MGARAQALSLASKQYSADELVLIDGGGNDANDLAKAYANNSLLTFLTQSNVMNTETEIDHLQSDPTGTSAGITYMQRLADKFYNENIKPYVLDMGAKRVAVLNIPDITITPLFQSQISGLPPAAAESSQALIRALISEFNKRLKTNIGTDSRIALVDFYSDFQDEVAEGVQRFV